jgi:hypothetical protein
MIGQVAPANPAPPVFRAQPARAPIFRVQRQIDLIGAKPDRQIQPMTPIGHLGTRIDLLA